MKQNLAVYLVILVMVLPVTIRSQLPFVEDFGAGTPAGWTFPSNWQVGSVGYSGHQVGNPPPAAFFYWSPAVTNYSDRLTSPWIDTDEAPQVKVFFDMELDFYAPGGLEGLAIEYRTGDGSWNEVLSYEIAAGVSVNFSLSTQAFIANVTDSIQLGFRAYGLNSYNINSWDIDNVKVKNIPSLIDVTIISNNQINSSQATVGDLILLTFEGSTVLSSTAAIIGVTEVYPVNLQGNVWQTSYTVQQDLDDEGPIPFVIMFTDNSNVDGTPVSETMDGSLVLIDNSGPGPFAVDTVIVSGGTIMGPAWNSTNTAIDVSVPLPPDSAVTSFNYTDGNSLTFNDNKSLIIPNSIELRPLSALTVEAWIKPTGYNDWQGFFDQATYSHSQPDTTISGYGWVYFGSGWHFVIGGTGVGINSPTVNDFPVVATQTNVWTHIAATYNGSKIYVYRNGTVVDSAATSFNSIHYTNLADPLIIGSFNSNGTDHYFNGKIDEVRVWDTARTKVKIQGYMSIPLTGNEPNLVGYWKIDEESNGYVNDESPSGNNAQINGALWVNDSPIDFKTPVYDYSTIAGSYIQLTAKEGVNPAIEMTDIGDLIEILIADANSGTKVATAIEASFESTPGLVNTSTITIGAKILDAAGNTTIGTNSTRTIYVEHVAELPDSVNIISDNSYSNQVANSGSNITLFYRSGEPINSSTVYIADRAATVTAISGNDYQATLVLDGTEPSGPLSISLSYIDTMANILDPHPTTTDDSEVVNDKSAPQINIRQISSSNSNSNWAKVDDTVWVNFTANEALRPASINLSIFNRPGSESTIYNNQGDQTFSYYIVTNNSSDPQGPIGFQILTFSDYAGNLGTVAYDNTTDGSSVQFDSEDPYPLVINNVIATGGTVAENYWNSTNTGISIAVTIHSDLTLIEGEFQILTMVNGNNAGALGTYVLSAGDIGIPKTVAGQENFEELSQFGEESNVTFYGFVSDAAGNTATGPVVDDISIHVDQIPPNLANISIYSSNNDQVIAILGDTVFVEFIGSEAIDSVNATIGGQPIDSFQHVNGVTSSVLMWRRMTGTEPEGILPFSVTAGDTARNMSTIYTEAIDSVDFSAAGPEILLANIRSNSSYGDTLAKPGDSIIVDIRTDMPISLNSASISGQTAADESPSSNRYIYNIVVAENAQDGIVQFSIDYSDLNGNPYSDYTTTTDSSYVRLDGTDPEFPDISISSTGSDPTIAGANDTINLTFHVDEAVSDSSAIILNNTANSITALNNNYFRASYAITGIEGEGKVRFTITATDLAGNNGSIDSTTNNSYVVFDQTPPSNFTVGQVISKEGTEVPDYWNATNQNIEVTVPIDNDSSLFDGAVQVLVSFNGGDTLEIGDPLTIDSVNTDETIDISRIDFVTSQDFAQGATALFTARINDFAGYTTIGTASNDQLQIDIVGPVIDSIAIKSNNPYNNQGATYEEDVFIFFRVQEEINTPTVIIEGDTADNTYEVDINAWEAFKKLDSSDVEGIVNFSLTPFDLSGNQGGTSIQTTDGSRVIYDYSPPFINNINEGGIIDKDYTASTDSLRLVMDGGDLISGIYRYYYALSTFSSPELGDAIIWNEFENFTSEVGDTLIDDLSLETGNKYYAKAYAMDGAGNVSDTIVGDGITVDIIAPTEGTIEDGFDLLNDSLDWTIDSTQLEVRWQGFSDRTSNTPPKSGIIGSYYLSILDEPDTVKVLDWFMVDTLADSVTNDGLTLHSETITGLTLQKNMEYFVAVRAVDMAGNISDSVRTDGISFDNQPARLDTVTPSLNNYLDVLSAETINFKFNKDVTDFSFSLSNIGMDTLPYNIDHLDSTVTVTLSNKLLTADTLHFNFDSVTSLNDLVMSETITMYSMLWGDLDSNHVLDVADVVRFNTLWGDIDLAPVADTTEPPHYAPTPDGEANLRDLYIFSRMWNWYYQTYIPTMLMTPGNNVDVSATYSGGQLRIQLPENTSAGQIIFTDLNYDLINVSGSSSSAPKLVFVNEDSAIGVKVYTFASLGETQDSVFAINANLNTETDYHQGIQVRFYDQEGKEILAGTALLKITPVPARYALGQNYPNPFNPTTTIHFELPEDAHTRIAIYDLLGREIVLLENRPFNAGYHQVVWQGRDTYGSAVPSGMYFYRMEANGFSRTRKMVFLK